MSEWYVAVDGQQRGPMREEEVVGRLRSGALGADAYVYGAGMKEWTPVAHVPALARHLPGAAPAAASSPASSPAPAPAAAAAPLQAVSPRPQPAVRPAGAAAGGEVPSHSLA